MSSSLRVGSQPSTQNPGQTTTQTSPTNTSNLASLISNNRKTVAIGIALLAGAKIIHSYPTATLLCVLGLGAFYLHHASSQKTEEQTTAKTEYKDLGSIQAANDSIKRKMASLRREERELALKYVEQRMSIRTDPSLTEEDKTKRLGRVTADYETGLQEFMKEKNGILAKVCEIQDNLCKLTINEEEQPQSDRLETYLAGLKNKELPSMGSKITNSENATWQFLQELTIQYNNLIKNANEAHQNYIKSQLVAKANQSELELQAAAGDLETTIIDLQQLMSKLADNLEAKSKELTRLPMNLEIDTLRDYCELLHKNSIKPEIISHCFSSNRKSK